MRVGILQELLEAIERRDWTDAMTIGRAALEQVSKMQEGAPGYSSPEERERYFDLDQADFIEAMHQAVVF